MVGRGVEVSHTYTRSTKGDTPPNQEAGVKPHTQEKNLRTARVKDLKSHLLSYHFIFSIIIKAFNNFINFF